MLELKKIHKSYQVGTNKQHVLKGISINFRQNEFVSILGQSGSGKTTLLNIIGGLDHYDEGNLIIEGVSTKQYKDKNWDSYRNHRVGFIFQSYNLITHQTILANVELALTLSGIPKKERREKAIKALTKVGLKEHIDKRPNQLSGGQMQRVAIARALVNDPDIILADEPTGALDSHTSVQIMKILKEIAEDKLVIMVTHNPDLAHEYSTRIVELKDGVILNDTNPYDEKHEKEEIIENRKTEKTSMSFWASLALSFNNLMTKKGRTFLTAFAGSMGIIGIALILSLSNGVAAFVTSKERDSLTDFPLAIEEQSVNLTEMLTDGVFDSDKTKCPKGKICSSDDIHSQIKSLTEGKVKQNNLEEFKKYIDSSKEFKKNASEIQYGYNLDLQIYSTKHSDYVRTNPNNFSIYDLANVKNDVATGEFASLLEDDKPDPVFTEILENKEIRKDRYKVLAGRYPKKYNELVLIVDENDVVPDSVLYALDIKDRNELKGILDNKGKLKKEKYDYDDILNTHYKLVLNTDYYRKENGIYRDYSTNPEVMKDIVNNGLDMEVVGILQLNKKSTSDSNVIGYTHDLTEYVINSIEKTDIYKEQTENKDINVLTSAPFDETFTYDATCYELGIVNIDKPSKINVYPKDFDSKDNIVKLINKYNKKQKNKGHKENTITYTDLLKTLIGSITSIVNIVSMVLIGFVAISLIVSSIMIAIITHISVLERTKEIGILRAIGASKKDIKRVFRAETVIEGFVAGAMGVIMCLAFSFIINKVAAQFVATDHLAHLPLLSAVLLILLSTLLTVIAGTRPSKIASKKDPVEALRTE